MDKRIEADIPILGRVFVNFLPLSTKLYNLYSSVGEIERQKNISHLGLISQAHSGIKHTRYDYLILQCVISELVENNFKGTTSAQGSIKINGTQYLGNDIIKAWFLLSNFGHCRNTIGDEKALLLKVIQRKGTKTKFLNQLKDDELKLWGAQVIDNFDYVNFHHLISIRRVYKSLKRRVALQKELIDIYKLLLLPIRTLDSLADLQRVQQLRTIHDNIRELAQISLDTRNSSLPINIDILSTILSFDFHENRFEQTEIKSIFNPLILLLYDSLYLNEKSQLHQRAYELKALETFSSNYDNELDRAITDGLANVEDCSLQHFVRFKLHERNVDGEKITDLLRNALTVQRGVVFAEASVDLNPITNTRVIDFYIHPEKVELSMFPRYLSNIAQILDDHANGTIHNIVAERRNYIDALNEGAENLGLNEADTTTVITPFKDLLFDEIMDEIKQKNIPSYRNLLWSVLRLHLKESYYFDIDHHVNEEYHFFGVKDDEEDYLTEEIEKAINLTANPDRKHELKQLLKSVSRKFDGTVIACLQRIKIYDYSKAPGERDVTDIDSLVLKFNNEKMYLEFHESKNTRNPFNDAKKDLKKKFIKTLSSYSNGYTISKVTGLGAKVVVKHSA
jgi:hypothetical protein